MDYKVKDVDTHSFYNIGFGLLTMGVGCLGGCREPTYTVEFQDGSEATITAKDRDELDRKIREGKY